MFASIGARPCSATDLIFLLVSLLGEPFGRLEPGSLAQLRRRGALALGLMPSDLRTTGG